jgi:hypothetical protein
VRAAIPMPSMSMQSGPITAKWRSTTKPSSWARGADNPEAQKNEHPFRLEASPLPRRGFLEVLLITRRYEKASLILTSNKSFVDYLRKGTSKLGYFSLEVGEEMSCNQHNKFCSPQQAGTCGSSMGNG